MIVKPPPGWCSIYPIRFARPSVINDTPQARAKLERDYRKFLRELQEAVQCFGPDRLEQDLRDLIKGQQGRTPDAPLNALLLDEWDAAVAVDPTATRTESAKGFYDRYRQQFRPQSVRAVEKRLTRLLQARERKAERERKLLAKLKRPTLIGTESAAF
jgi:hypothetical protein